MKASLGGRCPHRYRRKMKERSSMKSRVDLGFDHYARLELRKFFDGRQVFACIHNLTALEHRGADRNSVWREATRSSDSAAL